MLIRIRHVLQSLCVATFTLMIFAPDSIQDVTFRMFEHPQPKKLVGNIFHNARIQTPVRSVRLDSVEPRWLTLFHLDRSTGNLYTSERATDLLDREAICPTVARDWSVSSTEPKCVMNLLASINNRILIKINIIVEDLNDNRPLFPKTGSISDGSTGSERLSSQTVVVDETDAINSTKIRLPIASDLDESGMQKVHYYLSPDGTPFQLVHHSRSNTQHGIEELYLVPKEPLDYEEVPEYWINITACDGEIRQKTNGAQFRETVHCSSQEIHLVVRNKDDEKPVFVQKNYTAIFKSSAPIGYEILTVKAVDSDAPPFNKVIYELLFNSPTLQDIFKIDTLHGRIQLAGKISRPGIYQFYVLAASPTNYNASYMMDQLRQNIDRLNAEPNVARVTLHVIDANNHAPTVTLQSSKDTSINLLNASAFMSTESTVFIQLPENTLTPRTLAYFKVIDPDNAANGQVDCDLQTVRTDLPNSAVPMIKHDLASVLELNQVSQLTKHVSIYRLILNQPLDAEYLVDHQEKQTRLLEQPGETRAAGLASIQIRCKDNGDPVLTGSMFVNLVILDVDEYLPHLQLKIGNQTLLQPIVEEETPYPELIYNITVKENIPVGTTICTLFVSDKDVFSRPIFELRNNVTLIRVNRSTGQIILARPFDFEICRWHKLLVTVSEYENSTSEIVKLTVVINIDLEDINDNAPIFTHPPLMNNTIYSNPPYQKRYHFDGLRQLQVPEELPEGTKLGQIKAIDPDTGLNAEIRYFLADTLVLLSKNWSGIPMPSTQATPVFMINNEGFVWSKGRLDRETIRSIDLLVGAHDMGTPSLTSYTSVRITLTDINDHEPKWQFPTDRDQLVIVSLNTKVGSTVTRVRAVDPDDPLHNGRILYALLPLNDTLVAHRTDTAVQCRLAHVLFTVHENSGEVVLRQPVNNLPHGFLDVWLIVTDQGKEKQLYSVSKLIVYLAPLRGEVHSETILSKYQDKSNLLVNRLRSSHSLDHVLSSLASSTIAVERGYYWNGSNSRLPVFIGGVVTFLILLLIIIVSVVLWKSRHRRQVLKKQTGSASHLAYIPGQPASEDYADQGSDGRAERNTQLKQDIVHMRNLSPKHTSNHKRNETYTTLSKTNLSYSGNGVTLDSPDTEIQIDSKVFQCHKDNPLRQLQHISTTIASTVDGIKTQTTTTYIPVNSFIKFPSTVPLKIVTLSTNSYPMNAGLSESESERSYLNFPNVITSIVPVCHVPPDFIPVCGSAEAIPSNLDETFVLDRCTTFNENTNTTCAPQFVLTTDPVKLYKNKFDSSEETELFVQSNNLSQTPIVLSNVLGKTECMTQSGET